MEPGLRWAGVISVEKAYIFDPKPSGLPPEVAARNWWACMAALRVGDAGGPRQNGRNTWLIHALPTWPNRLDAAIRAGLAGVLGQAFPAPSCAARRGGRGLPRPSAACGLERFRGHYQPALFGSGGAIRPRWVGDSDSSSELYLKPFTLPKGAVPMMRTFRPNGRSSRTVRGLAGSERSSPVSRRFGKQDRDALESITVEELPTIWPQNSPRCWCHRCRCKRRSEGRERADE